MAVVRRKFLASCGDGPDIRELAYYSSAFVRTRTLDELPLVFRCRWRVAGGAVRGFEGSSTCMQELR